MIYSAKDNINNSLIKENINKQNCVEKCIEKIKEVDLNNKRKWKLEVKEIIKIKIKCQRNINNNNSE